MIGVNCRFFGLLATRLGLLVGLLASPAQAEPREAAAPALPRVVQAAPDREWNARFAFKTGLIGGDGVYSVVLDKDRTLWLFGDSLVGTVKDGGRPGAVMVNNWVVAQYGHKEDAAFRFVPRTPKDGKPRPFFASIDEKSWFWPQAGIRLGDRLFVFLAQIAKGSEPGAFGFRHVGQWLAVIDNPQDKPDSFHIKPIKMPFARFGTDPVRSCGSAILAEGDFLYIYGYEERGKKLDRRRLLVARVPAARVDDFTTWRFRTENGWSGKPEESAPLATGLAPEFSVSRTPNGSGYVLVYTENGLGDRIVARFARAPQGPWSEPLLLYRCPEMAKDRGLFCYSAKAHAWVTTENELLISYCVNAWDFGRLFRDETVYRPKFVRVRLEPAR